MKYAYIHESSSENRQSLDAYMLILETWKKRDIQYEEKVEKALVQEGIEKSSIYETEYDKEKKVIDVSSYLDYLSTIKKFDVPKYMQLLTGLEKAKTDEDLEKAKSAFKDFEEQVYGFKEQEQVGDNHPAKIRMKMLNRKVQRKKKDLRKKLLTSYWKMDSISKFTILFMMEKKRMYFLTLLYIHLMRSWKMELFVL